MIFSHICVHSSACILCIQPLAFHMLTVCSLFSDCISPRSTSSRCMSLLLGDGFCRSGMPRQLAIVPSM